MAYAQTYNSLVDSIQKYNNRSDTNFVNQIPEFIGLAIERITNDLNNSQSGNLGSEIYVYPQNPSTLQPGVSILNKPALWRMTLAMNIGGDKSTQTPSNTWNPLKLRRYESLRQDWPDATQTGFPEFYCDYGYGKWLIAPTPNAAYPIQIAYLQKFTPIDADNQSNWLTQYAPEVFLLQCLVQSSIFTQNSELIEQRKQAYTEALSALISQDKGRQTDRFSQGDKD